jgi:hypothetical protein
MNLVLQLLNILGIETIMCCHCFLSLEGCPEDFENASGVLSFLIPGLLE